MKSMKDINLKNITGAMTFKKKILLMSISGLVLASFVYTFDALRSEHAIMKDEIIKRTKIVTELASQLGELPLISGNPEHMRKALGFLGNVQDVSFVAFYDFDMNLLEKTGVVPMPVCDHPRKLDLSFVEEDTHFDLCSPVFTTTSGEDIDLFHEAEEGKAVRKQVGWVRLGFSKAHMIKTSQEIIYRGLGIAIVFTLISIALIYKLLAVTTRPLTLLSGAVQKVRNGNYPEISVSSRDEIGILTSEFNRMSKAISEREEMLVTRARLSAFVSDIGFVLTEGAPLPDTLQQCADIIVTQIDTALARIWIFNAEEDAFELQASSGIYTLADSPVSRLSAGASAAWKAARQLHPHFTSSTDMLDAGEWDWARQAGIKSFAVYPLSVESRLVGILEIFSRKQLLEETFNTLDTVSDEIAIGIQRKLAEQHIKASLGEKEVLLREIHHRVKNNMQVISSLLNFQTRYIKDKQYVTMLNESQNRIKSMALIHEKLYRSSDLSNIDFCDYISSLAKDLFKFYSVDTGKIALKLDIGEITFEIDTAIPCGLLINELLTNSLKHAFPDGRHGEINISLRKKEIAEDFVYELAVSDNGIGIPEDFDIGKTKSLGLQLIKTLTEHQLQGKLEMDRSNGTKFLVSFKELKYKKRI